MMCPECSKFFMDAKELIRHMEEKEYWKKDTIVSRLTSVGVISSNELKQLDEYGDCNG